MKNKHVIDEKFKTELTDLGRMNRRTFVKMAGMAAGAVAFGGIGLPKLIPGAEAAIPGGSLDPNTIPKYATSLINPGVMPKSRNLDGFTGDYYEIAVRQFQQQVLPTTDINGNTLGPTTVWSYGSATAKQNTFNYPAFTIEALADTPVRVKWINDLVVQSGPDKGKFLPHLLPVDQTLHWANPPGPIDSEGTSQQPYTGPVPIVVHLHGAHSSEESDGFPEAWFLPNARNLQGFTKFGSQYDTFKQEFFNKYGVTWDPGTAVFQYDNAQRATTMWYHDHALGLTRNNVYAGPAGFYLLRGGTGDLPAGVLPSGAYEIPLIIQDRSFNTDGSLFYPADRAFFEGITPAHMRIPFKPDIACDGLPSDISPIHNPEFFGNTMVVNGHTWPFLQVEQRRYRFRFLNGSDSRFLILKMDNGMSIWQIGADGGFLSAPFELDGSVPGKQLLLGPAERADVIIDFTNVRAGTNIILQNIGPDEPFGGGIPGIDFISSDPNTTGQVIQFRVVRRKGQDTTTPPDQLMLPAITHLGDAATTRQVSLNEHDSASVRVVFADGNINLNCQNDKPFYGPAIAGLGTVNPDNTGNLLRWNDAITETPAVGATEIWEIYDFTEDAHPIHIHEVQFEVVNREVIGSGTPRDPEAWEKDGKDTVVAYPGEITRVKATYDRAGLFVWHCHILSHEDHEMMRPYRIS